jgi:hypothetical protein
MKRRGFLGMIGGVLGLVLHGRAAQAASPPIYTYDWQKEYTDDPRFKGKHLPYGGEDIHTVLVDGKKLAEEYPIFALRTGPGGYVKTYHFTKEEVKVISGCGGIKKLVHHRSWEEGLDGNLKVYTFNGTVDYIVQKIPE